LAVLVVITALCCAGCLQELPLGDKYINEAVGLLRVQNTSTEASYIITAVELRNSAGEVIKTWEGLGKDGQGLQQGETWIGDLDLEGSFTLYCTVKNTEEETTGTFYHKTVEIKLHEVADSGITGEVYLSTADTDNDGFSDFWESNTEGFNPDDSSDGGTVYVSTTIDTITGKQLGTAKYPYFTLFDGVEKAKRGLTEDARTVVVLGHLTRANGNPGSDNSVICITDTGLHGVTVAGEGSVIIDAGSSNPDPGRALYLGPGTKLTLKNITIQKGYAYRGSGIHADGAELILGEGLVIHSGHSDAGSSSGTGVYASNGAVVLMKDGSLIGDDDLVKDAEDWPNEAWQGGGVALFNGSSLTMENGSRIKGNYSASGGAVSADLGSLIVLKPGAQITANTGSGSPCRGGGVHLTGGSKMLMEGGLITGNSVGTASPSGGGGGVYVGGASEMEMRDGEISGNTVPAGNGGGVYVDTDGVFRMTGGIIANNTVTTGNGGGVYVDGGKFFKTGGTVYGSDDFGNRNTAGDENKTGNGHAFFATDPDRPADKTLPDSFTL
jgi:hypothetical protein